MFPALASRNTAMNLSRPLLLLSAALALGGCGSRDTTDDVGDGGAFSDPADTLAPGGAGLAFDTEDTADPSSTGGSFDFDADPATDPTLDLDADPATGPTLDLDADPATDPTLDLDADPATDGLLDPGAGAVTDDGAAAGDPPVLVPAVPGSRDAERVLSDVRTVLGRTLLDLNGRLAGGLELSAQEDDCLGTHEPGLGEPLLAIDCARALATEPVAVYVERGAFYPTAACRADLALGVADGCVVDYASLFSRTEFDDPIPPARPRPLPGSGFVIRYAVDAPVLEVANDENALSGVFRCEIDLATGSVRPTLGGGSCDTILGNVADRLDALLAAAD